MWLWRNRVGFLDLFGLNWYHHLLMFQVFALLYVGIFVLNSFIQTTGWINTGEHLTLLLYSTLIFPMSCSDLQKHRSAVDTGGSRCTKTEMSQQKGGRKATKRQRTIEKHKGAPNDYFTFILWMLKPKLPRPTLSNNHNGWVSCIISPFIWLLMLRFHLLSKTN